MVIITNFSPPEDGILHHEAGCELIVEDQSAGTGDLYVTENCVTWNGAQGSCIINLAYRQISLHAIQRTPSPLIFMMIDYKLTLPGQQPQEEVEDEFDPDEMPSTQLKFVPQNEASLSAIYEALNTGQNLHPDPDDSVSDDDFMIADEAGEHPEDAANRMENLTIEQSNGNGISADDDEDDDEQFADA